MNSSNHDRDSTTRVLAARWVFPINRPPIHGGWVQVHGNQITGVGGGTPVGPAKDLGDVALLPGFVNAHTHLEFSDLDEPIGQPGVPLHDWIGQVVNARAESTTENRSAAIQAGIGESDRFGVQLIGEISTPPCDYHCERTGPEICPLVEVLGLNPSRSDERLESAIKVIQDDRNAGISPHAPYSTNRTAIQSCVDLATLYGRSLAMHVAESPAERELLQNGGGPFASTLKAMGVWNEGLFPWSDDPICDLIKQLSKAPRALLVHGNDLTETEINAIARCRNLSVVYCPRTHAFFQYDQHPVHRLLAAGVRVALGTDSRASNPDLNLWAEAQHLLRHRVDLNPHDVLQMATIHGAEALGRTDVGRIAPNCRASLATIPTNASRLEDVYADLSQASPESIQRWLASKGS